MVIRRLLAAGRPFLVGILLAAARAAPPLLDVHRLPDGHRYGLIGEHAGPPAPTVFVFQGSLESCLADPIYTRVAQLLKKQGYLGVVLDAPAHGEDTRPGEPKELAGWRYRVDHGGDLVGPFIAQARATLDYLVARHQTDPTRVAACGTSRGGFLAFHFAAAEPRIRLIAAISPVVDLMTLREFHGANRAEAERLSLFTLIPQLKPRPVWLSIGNHDRRVGTDPTIAFFRSLVAAYAPPGDDNAVIPVELIVAPTAGHTNIDQAHELIAAWILAHFASLSPPS